MILGILTIALTPFIIGSVVRIMQKYSNKYPTLTNAISIVTLIVVGAILISMSIVFAVVYHHLLLNGSI